MGKCLIGSVGLKPGTDTGFDLDEKGQIHSYSDTQFALPVGDDNQILSSLASEASGLKWVAAGAGDMVLDEVQTVTASKSYSADLIITDAATIRVGGTTPTISSGALTMVANTARADTEGAISSDDLSSITIPLGAFVNLHAINDSRTIVVKDGTLISAGDFSLENSADTWFALRNPQNGFVIEISRSDNG